ncbi:MAG: hypothetical protein ACYDC5_00805 [Candidatus Dormibacteria bacterium]
MVDVVSFTSQVKARSRAVMRRLGMTHDAAADFQHPNLAADHPLSPHVLYQLPRASWSARGRHFSGRVSCALAGLPDRAALPAVDRGGHG